MGTRAKQIARARAGMIDATPEQLAKGESEQIDLGDIDKAQRGQRATRLSSGWRPAAALSKGLLTRRQAEAAARLQEQWDMAGFDAIKGQSWRETVDSSGGGSDVGHRIMAARHSVMDKLRALPELVRDVVVNVVVFGRSVEVAGASLTASWLPKGAARRTANAGAFLGLGLDLLADAYGL